MCVSQVSDTILLYLTLCKRICCDRLKVLHIRHNLFAGINVIFLKMKYPFLHPFVLITSTYSSGSYKVVMEYYLSAVMSQSQYKFCLGDRPLILGSVECGTA